MSGGTNMAQLPGMPSWGQGWLDAYLAQADRGDVVRGDVGRGARWWHHLFDGVATLTEGRLQRLQDRVGRQVDEIGTAFRLPGDSVERRWQSSALPLLIGEDEWQRIAIGVSQRAELMERVLGDIYGPAELVSSGALPAALATGSPHFWRAMIGMPPPGGHRLHIYAVDLARGPDGEWRVLADHTRAPIGAGYALENRLASSRVMGALQTRLNIQRLAAFFAAFREGLAASCRRANPRIGLLTPGRYNPSYAEQAHLARYLGLLLVEGDDLAVRGDELFVRTIEGLKRIDGLWRRIDTRFLDPLAFDNSSRIGVPGLMDVLANGNAVIANLPGAGLAESPAMAAFLPALSRRLLGEELKLPNIATWWCGQQGPCAEMVAQLDELLVTPAFGRELPGLTASGVLAGNLSFEARQELIAAIARRPQDYVGQEVVQLSTMPVVAGGRVVPRPFILRAFAARNAHGNWEVMPGGFARIGEQMDMRATVMGAGAFSADCGVVALGPVEPVSLLPPNVAVRRNPGTLPSRAADNLFWLGRYIERADATVRLVRATLGGTLDADGGASLVPMTLDRLATLLISTGAAKLGGEDEEDDEPEGSIRDLAEMAEAALDGPGLASVRSLFATAHGIAEVIRERLAADVWRLIDMALPKPIIVGQEDAGAMLARAAEVQERCSALAGLAAENMGRTAGWRFHDLGRRIERALSVCRLVRSFATDQATADDLTTLLDLGDSQISYRARYLTGLALVPVRDLVALDPFNPRSIAFQIARIREHLAELPTLRDDGIAEEQVSLVEEIGLIVATTKAEAMSPTGVLALENRLMALSDAIGRRYFLQDAETLRAPGMTLA
ncbi:putative circularly permuted ATP-grasp superfamily protein/putative alpha-E superfamily protein [Sphingomonas vulcanisoli]|uniref:Circularly permuted ATP-grasp superfamily protein/putative alpha-E superfamily protein n=1 Tax=Sphingomonas vulcanisoli TaxID=1658060 RepID=A0ABX0TRS8_9SPHN|nr:circularly permuted type 2 ATP-grasp protein [Sphingomonas vulcanisoli]NIJ07439.1 putative circularly permuted ATP-grasp superfamily protein/putative alpha-E superfamily protein [Sphingomonas vulcanisoli]